MTDETIKPEAVAGLAAKLAALELDDDERATLDGILDRAADTDVEGFGVVFEVETTYKERSGDQLLGAADNEWVAKVGKATGMDLSRLGVWTDMRP